MSLDEEVAPEVHLSLEWVGVELFEVLEGLPELEVFLDVHAEAFPQFHADSVIKNVIIELILKGNLKV